MEVYTVACREPLIGYSTVNSLSALQWLHMQQSNMSRNKRRAAAGSSVAMWSVRQLYYTTLEEMSQVVFSEGLLWGYIIRLTEMSSISGVE